MRTRDKVARPVKTTDTVFEVIETLKEQNSATTSEIADQLNMAVSTIHGHLATLETKEYVVKENGEYRLGQKFLDLGTHAKKSLKITEIVQPWLENLAEETGEVAWLLVEEHGWGVFLMRETGEQAVRTHGRVGKRTYLHTTSAGKAMLANFPKKRLDEIIDLRGLPACTSQTITDRQDLMTEIEEIRDRGFAYNRSELINGHRGVSSPVMHNGDVKGAAGIAGPAKRLKGTRFTEAIPDTVLGATNAMELSLEYD